MLSRDHGFDAAEAQGQGRKASAAWEYRATVVEPGASRSAIGSSRSAAGVVMPLHRHTGAIHAFNLQGKRRLCTGEIVGPGDYVFEPPGNTDWWEVVGDEALVALVVVMGEVQFLAEDRSCSPSSTRPGQWEDYRRHCGMHGLPLADIR